MMSASFILSAAGLVLSFYALHVEQYAGRKKGYQAMCDINEELSCTRAFTSDYGQTWGVSNAVYGVFFYLIVLMLSIANESGYILVLSLCAVIGSVYLAYVQYGKLRTLCVVCTAIYLINILLLIFSFRAAF
jgi:vitamin-K-epoxide reductase (warfarin-sensitive)